MMFGGIYSRKWSNMTEMFLLFVCKLKVQPSPLGNVVFSLLGKVPLVKIKQVMW